MAQVVKATVGSGWLSPGVSTWLGWKVTWGDVWLFWVDPTQSSPDQTLEIVAVRNRRLGADNWAQVKIENVGGAGTTYFLRVARIF